MTPCGFNPRRFGLFARAQFNWTVRLILATFCLTSIGASVLAQSPAVNTVAPDFTLSAAMGTPPQMFGTRDGQPFALRNNSRYRCPYCLKQTHGLTESASTLAMADQHVRDFFSAQPQLPRNAVLVIDPDYPATGLYGLGRNTPNRVTYPAIFIPNKYGMVISERISHTYGDRLSGVHLSAQDQ